MNAKRKARPGGKPPTRATKPAKAARKPTRAEVAAAEAARRRAQRNRLVALGAVVLLAVVVGVVVASKGGAPKKGSAKKAATPPASSATGVNCTTDTKSDSFTTPGGHVPDPTYKVDPPDGGDHLPTPSPPGIFTAENAPADGAAVHSMEHGYVVIWYRPDLPAADRATLEAVTRAHASDLLLVPRPTLPGDRPVAATAWHHRLLCTGVDQIRLNTFVTDFANKGPERVPH